MSRSTGESIVNLEDENGGQATVFVRPNPTSNGLLRR